MTDPSFENALPLAVGAPRAFADEGARISCVMVTGNRRALARRAVACFLAQDWPNRELVIVDDGDEDYAPILADIPADRLTYHRLEKRADSTLGRLRNLSLELAGGAMVAQWDDDDWYHPARLSRQAQAMDAGGAKACVLAATLMHLDAPEWRAHAYVGGLKPGVPGTILHVADPAARYPETRRGEDTVFLDHWQADELAVLDAPELFLRAFHGSNTWERAHFERRLRNSPASAAEYWLRRVLRGDVFGHRRFRLGPRERAAFDAFLADSRHLELMK